MRFIAGPFFSAAYAANEILAPEDAGQLCNSVDATAVPSSSLLRPASAGRIGLLRALLLHRSNWVRFAECMIGL